jgi:hypothetical protein
MLGREILRRLVSEAASTLGDAQEARTRVRAWCGLDWIGLGWIGVV